MHETLSVAEHEFLTQAVRLAMKGRGAVEPNPMVGCVIVKEGRIIGQGWHQQFGAPHAEPNALASCTESPQGATAYVTLEPCCHTNKKTPPCVPTLIAARLSRVVVGCQDPNPMVRGRGIAQLREAGIFVDEVDDSECRQLIAPFIARTLFGHPYVTLKWAQSADGKVAGAGGRRVAISNHESNRAVHLLRSRCDAILVGISTVAIDDPLLTARGVEPHRPLLRMVLDSDLRLSIDSQLVRTIDRSRVIAFSSKEAAHYSGTRTPLAACGVEIHPVASISPGKLDLHAVIKEIGIMGVTDLLVEPGPTLAKSFLHEGVWDRAWVFRSPKVIGEDTAPLAPDGPVNPVTQLNIQGDLLTEYLNPQGVYAGDFPSADIFLEQNRLKSAASI